METPGKAASGPADALDRSKRDGVVAGLVAYTLWGFLPVYFKAVDSVLASEVLVHRIVWAVPFGALILATRRQWPEVSKAVSTARTMLWLAAAAAFIAINWLIYIVAVQHDQIYQASLGYYINPLMYVLVGVLFFGERLRGMQVAAVAAATAGVLVLTVSGGEVPVIALSLAITFTLYGVIRKRTSVGAMPGLFIETMLLLPAALGWLTWLAMTDRAAFAGGDHAITGLLLLAGPITVIPLLCFALAARRLPLSTIGFLQFLAPSLQFLNGLYYGEALTSAHLVCFVLIWSAVALFVIDVVRSNRRRAAAPVT